MPFEAADAKLTVELCRLAYRSAANAAAGCAALGLEGFRFFDGGNSTQAFVCNDAEQRFLAFRGTESRNPRDWMVDARFGPLPAALGSVHSGFNAALGEIWDDVRGELGGVALPLTVTGHSLGGGLAILAAARLADGGVPPATVYVYGCPRPGLGDFRDACDAVMRDRTYRVINHIDIVTRVPFLTQGYRAPGQRMYFDGSGGFHPDAGAWQVIKDDLLYRFTHFRSINALGLGSHEIGAYLDRVGSL